MHHRFIKSAVKLNGTKKQTKAQIGYNYITRCKNNIIIAFGEMQSLETLNLH